MSISTRPTRPTITPSWALPADRPDRTRSEQRKQVRVSVPGRSDPRPGAGAHRGYMRVLTSQSGRRESNPHDQLGRSVLAHGHLCCSSNALVSRSTFLRSVTAYLSVLLA